MIVIRPPGSPPTTNQYIREGDHISDLVLPMARGGPEGRLAKYFSITPSLGRVGEGKYKAIRRLRIYIGWPWPVYISIRSGSLSRYISWTCSRLYSILQYKLNNMIVNRAISTRLYWYSYTSTYE